MLPPHHITAANMLSPETINCILSYVTGEPAYDLTEWMVQLELLQVNRQWRSLAAPHVFSQLFIELADNDDNGSVDGLDDAETELISNISPVASSHSHRQVKSLDIRIEGSVDFISYLNNAIKLLGSRALSWPSITTLRLSFMLDELPINAHKKDDDVLHIDEYVTVLCDSLFELLPNINHIEAIGPTNSVSCTLFTSKLVDLCSQNLRYLDCSFPLALMSPQFSTHLVHLSVEFDEASELQFPYVYPQSLEYLSLGNITGKMVWHSFYDQARSRSIEFANLKQMCVTYNPESEKHVNIARSMDANTKRMFQSISFPALSRFSFTLSPSIRGILELADFPAYLQALQITCPLGGSISTKNAMFDQMTRLSMANHVASGKIYKDFAHTPNFLLESGSFTKHASFDIDYTAKIPEDAAISWAKLSELTIHSKVSSAKLLNMISNLPELTLLHTTNVVINGSATGAANLGFEDIDWSSLPPLHNKLCDLELWFSNSSHAAELESALIKNLLSRMPTLKTVKVPRTSFDFESFAKEYENKLPHLKMFCSAV